MRIVVIWMLVLAACTSGSPEAAEFLPPGIVLHQRTPDYSAIEQASTLDVNNSELWSNVPVTSAKPSPNYQRVIAFDEDDQPLLLTPDGEIVTELDSRIHCPSFVSNTDIIAFTPWDEDGKATLHRWSIAESQEEAAAQIAATIGEFGGYPTCPVAAGDLIAFSDETGEVVLLEDGKETQRIHVGDEDCFTITYTTPPDDSTLPLNTNCGTAETSGLFIYDVGTGDITQLVAGFVGAPSYSPDGRFLLFGRAREECCEPFDIWVAHADGSNKKMLIENASWPTFIPTPIA